MRVIPEVKKQFEVVKRLHTRGMSIPSISAPTGGVRGEYIYRPSIRWPGFLRGEIRKRV